MSGSNPKKRDKSEKTRKPKKGVNYENRERCAECGHFINLGAETRLKQSAARRAWWARKREREAAERAELERARELTARLAEEQEQKEKIENDKMLLFL